MKSTFKAIKKYIVFIIITILKINKEEVKVYNISLDEKYNKAYSDLNGRTLYLVKAKNDAEKISNIRAVLKTFGHLPYFFKTNLLTGVKKKISTYNYKEGFEDLKIKRFEAAVTNWKNNQGLDEINDLLDNNNKF